MPPAPELPARSESDDAFLDAELSLLAFQHRVLSLAADPAVPLMERCRFLGIVTSNLDELYMVRMVELRGAAAAERVAASEVSFGAATQTLTRVEAAVEGIMARMDELAAKCLADAAHHGVRLVRWPELTHVEQDELRALYQRDIQPTLHSHAVTLSPGHPLPHLAHLGMFVAVVYRDGPGERLRVAEHELPRDLPRLLRVPGRSGHVIPLEDVLCANVAALYPDVLVESAHLFRLTRGGDLPIGDDDALDLLDAVDRATMLRPLNPAVRVEVERSMPAAVSALLLESLHREASARDQSLTVTAVQVVNGLIDLRCLTQLPFPEGDASLTWPPLPQHSPVAGRSMLTAIRDGDVLAHHPFDSFDDTVVRFFEEAAADPDVTSIAATLYRVGNPSPIAGALLLAAQAGKRVFALVELQARFDEEHNVRWARAIERAGGQVVYGLPGLKVHAKAALVVRREGEVLRRYVHVGSGNYNPRSGRQYTDLSLFSARASLGEDIAALFRALSGEDGGVARAPAALPREALVAPEQLRPALLERIAREISHAKGGRACGITAKVNALADREMVRALYAASQAGVPVRLVVRGICTLRPQVPGLSDNIQVVSVVGRLLEHSRVYRFENGGDREYFMGSSDLRPRNLRRRVELLVPILSPAHRAQLDELLACYLSDPSGWHLQGDGRYVPSGERGLSAQQQYLAGAQTGGVDER
jgi:polyphosphate kinase